MSFEQQTEVEPFRPKAQYIVLLGVAGSGKSVSGKVLAERLRTTFIEGDEYHPRANVEKVQRGLPLMDEDRWPWITHVAGAMRSHLARCEQGRRQGRKASEQADEPVETGPEADMLALPYAVCACSPMRAQHRDYLVQQIGEGVCFIELSAPRELIRARIREREDHYQASLQLDGQLAMMEPLQEHEVGTVIDASRSIEEVVEAIVVALRNGA